MDGNRAQRLTACRTLLLVMKMCTGFTTDVTWVNTRVRSVILGEWLGLWSSRVPERFSCLNMNSLHCLSQIFKSL